MRDFYIYHRPETNQDEKVEPWEWCWEAFYNDGTIFKQFNDDDGTFHQIREIDQKNLHFFRTINYTTGRFFDILWHPQRKIISGRLGNILDNGTRRVTFYYFGYETSINGTIHKVINVILEDGNIIVTEDLGRINVA